MSMLEQAIRTFLPARCSSVSSSSNGKTKNVPESERLVSAAAGLLLVKFGLHHRGISGLVGAGLGAAMIHRGYTGHCGLYETLGVSGIKPASPAAYFDHGVHVKGAITIDKPAQELYDFWRQFDNLPQFMGHLVDVNIIDQKTSQWTAKGPLGTQVKWTAEVINDVPGETIAWRSLAGAQMDNAGSVRFVPATDGRGTEVRVNLDYIPPSRQMGKWVAKLFGEEPTQQIHQDLRKFKQIMETGVIATIDGQPAGSKQN